MNTKEFESCYHKHFNFVYRLSFTYMKNQADAEDVTQETFLRLYHQRGGFESEEHVRRWLLRVAINLSKDQLKSHWKQRRQELDENMFETGSGRQNDQKEIWQEVAALPEKYRLVLYLYYYEGYSVREIGQMLRCSISAVKMRLKRGRKLLQLELEPGIEEWRSI